MKDWGEYAESRFDEGRGHERDCVDDFHRDVIGIAAADAPHMDPAACMLRARLIAEEACETVAALVGGAEARSLFSEMVFRVGSNTSSLADYCDGAADLRYLLHGSDLVLGVHGVADEVFDIVHASNMAKAGGVRDANGKLQKPTGWQPPDIAGLLQTRLGWTE